MTKNDRSEKQVAGCDKDMKEFRLHYKGNDIADKDSILVVVQAENEEEAKRKGYLEIWLDYIED
jgi:hypothetical protein